MSSRGGACGRCGGARRFWRRECRSCRSWSRAERAELAVDAGEAAIEFGALSWLGRGLHAVAKALFN